MWKLSNGRKKMFYWKYAVIEYREDFNLNAFLVVLGPFTGGLHGNVTDDALLTEPSDSLL